MPIIVGIMIIISLIWIVWIVPVVLIWSLNALFGLAIAPTLKTWFAAFLITGIIGGAGNINK